MGIRKNAAALTDVERDAFLEAVLKLKQRPAPNTTQPISLYDQFVALHGAVMAVRAPDAVDFVNFAHGNIGFLPWHRQYLRAFELALDAEVPGVALPYWDWSDDVGAAVKLFTADFLSSTSWGAPTDVADGWLRHRIPATERPPWWPDGLRGFEVNDLLEEGNGVALERGSQEPDWPPSAPGMKNLAELTIRLSGTHALWAFWLVLEQGDSDVTRRTHNAGHRFIGGHMAGTFSPNDPVFWLHHANVDRIWAQWQDYQVAQNPGSTHDNHWPDPEERSPVTGDVAPPGHKKNDNMWPWVGAAPGYLSVSVSEEILNQLPDLSAQPAVAVVDVLDYRALGYSYE